MYNKTKTSCFNLTIESKFYYIKRLDSSFAICNKSYCVTWIFLLCRFCDFYFLTFLYVFERLPLLYKTTLLNNKCLISEFT